MALAYSARTEHWLRFPYFFAAEELISRFNWDSAGRAFVIFRREPAACLLPPDETDASDFFFQFCSSSFANEVKRAMASPGRKST
jgi:hypothetical protein